MVKSGDGSAHKLEYAKAGTGKCHGPAPCKGSLIDRGALRYGSAIVTEQYGPGWLWRHWGCVTPDILEAMANCKLTSIQGYTKLFATDKTRVQAAIKRERVDENDIPPSARPLDWSHVPSSSSQPKPLSSQTTAGRKRPADSSFSSQSANIPISSQVIDIDSDEEFAGNIVDDVTAKDDLYTTTTTPVVGLQYYDGLVGDGEEVNIIREPTNEYDRNAIRVSNLRNKKVGHIKRDMAAKLAPLIDANLIVVEGTVHRGNMGGGMVYSIDITLKLYGAPNMRAQLDPRLRQLELLGTRGSTYASQAVVTPQSSSSYRSILGPRTLSAMPGPSTNRKVYAVPTPSQPRLSAAQQANAARKEAEQRRLQLEAQKATELASLVKQFERVDDEARRSSMLDALCSDQNIMSLPLHDNPPSIQSGELATNLMKHQSQALRWCLDKEYSQLPTKVTDSPVQFWKLLEGSKGLYYTHLVTNTPLREQERPALGRGGLMADAMGLGKTLTMISLIVATRKDVPKYFGNATLIIAPVSLLRTWENQIQEHCTRDLLSAHVYYDKSRDVSAEKLNKYDVVITSYQTVLTEWKASQGSGTAKRVRRQGVLFDVKWKRVILDEAHTIRNITTQQHKACYDLVAQRRWAVTGTPIINTPKDLGALVRFLRTCSPLDQEATFSRCVTKLVTRQDPRGAQTLKALLSGMCLRRTKEMQDSEGRYLIELPPVESTVIKVDLVGRARELYDQVESFTRHQFFESMESVGTTSQIRPQANILAMLTRMRQLALHPGLVPQSYIRSIMSNDDSDTKAATTITPEERLRLQHLLFKATEDNEECPVCFDLLKDPRVTLCGHFFCLECISGVISHEAPAPCPCPMCRRTITMSDLIEPLPPTDATQAQIRIDLDAEEEDEDLTFGSSAKIDQLLHLLRLLPSTEKAVVFSQFTSFLDKIADQLRLAGIPFVRFDGSMSATRRGQVLERFNIPLRDGRSASNPSASFLPLRRGDSFTHNIISDAPVNISGTGRPNRRAAQKAKMVVDQLSDDELTENKPGDRQDVDFLPPPPTFDSDDDLDNPFPVDITRAKGKATAKAKVSFSTGDVMESYKVEDDQIPVVMLISLKAGALGLQLTAANNVFLMDPWWQEGIESQAIDRCNRIGQTRTVHVYQMIAEDTVESKVLEIQEKKKRLIQDAFSGTKSKERSRVNKKEARLADLVELFGLRREQEEKEKSASQAITPA